MNNVIFHRLSTLVNLSKTQCLNQLFISSEIDLFVQSNQNTGFKIEKKWERD